MENVYQILLIEDDESDADLIQIELNKLSINIELDVVNEKSQLVERLENTPPHLVISDYSLPSFNAIEALKIVREKDPHLPFILVSGYIGEEKAVDAMLEGASDYAMKNNLGRLGPAILREIANYEKQTRTSKKLDKAQDRYQSLIQSVEGIVWEADAETFEFAYVSPQSKELLGYTPEKWLSESEFWKSHIHPEDRNRVINFCRHKTEDGENHAFEYRMISAEDEVVWLRDYVTVVTENGEPDRLRGLMVDITNEKIAEKQRDKAYRIADIGHWELDLVHQQLYWSDTVKRLYEVPLDYEPDLDTGITFFKEGKHRKKITEEVERAIETGVPFDVELKIITANGNEKWVRIVGETEFRNGQCIRIYGSTQDITQRKEAEQKLRDVVEHSTNMFYRHDTDYMLTYVSPQSKEFLGCSPEEAKRRWTEFVTDHPVNESGFQHTKRAIETGEAQPSYSLELEKTNGEKIWVRVNEAPLTENGETVAIVGSLTDITEQKKYEQKLQESLERYDYVIRATSDAIWDWNLEEDTVFRGSGFERLFGHELSIVPGDSALWTEHIHPDDREWVYESITETIKGEGQNWFEEYRYRKADGSYVFVEDRGFVIRDEEGHAVRMIGAIRDVSDEKKEETQHQLRQNISRFFKAEQGLDDILEEVLQHLAEFGNYNTAEIWLTSSSQKHQNLIATYAEGKKGRQFYNNSRQMTTFGKGEGLPGSVWESEKLLAWNNIDTSDSFVRRAAAQQAELRSALGIPLFHNEEVVGVMVFGSEDTLDGNTINVDFFEGLQHYIGAEIQRKQQEEELVLLFKSAPDILALVSRDGYFKKVNPAFCEIMGYTEGEVTNKPFISFVHPDDVAATKVAHEKNFESEKRANSFINRYRTKSGEYRWISWSSSEFIGHKQNVFAYGRDVTEQTKLKKLLQQTNQLASVGSWELDLSDNDDDDMYLSEMTREILEVDEDYNPSLTGGFEFYEPESKKRIEDAVEKAINEDIPFDEELLITTAKGNKRWVRCIGQADFEEGRCVRMYGSYQNIHDRKIAELELSQRNTFIETILDNLPIGIAVNQIDSGEALLMNKQFSKIYGWPQKDLADVDTFFEKVYPDNEYRQQIKSQVIADIESGDPERMSWNNIQITTKEDEKRIVNSKNIPLYDQNRMISTVIDVTAEKEAEREKTEILERIGDAFFAVDENWIVSYWNNQAEEVLGMPSSKIINKNLWDEYEEAVELDFYKQYHKAVDEQVTVHFQEYYPPVEKWLEVSAYPSETGLSVYFRDVTERKENEERIRQINERFEKVTEATNDAIWDFDATEGELFWGRGFETLFGYDLDEINPNLEFLISLIHPEDRDPIVQKIGKYMQPGTKTDWYEEYRFKKADGTYAPVMDRAVFIRNDKGEVIRVVGAITDLTKQKKNEEALKELNRELEKHAEELAASNAELEQFAYVASHDLQEPLRMVSSFLNRLEDKYGDQLDDKAHQYIDFAVDGAHRMRQIILDLLNYSRVGQNDFEREELCLDKLLDEIVKLEHRAIKDSGATIEWEQLPEIKAAETPIRQVFQNLISNAIKYRKPDTEPEIRIKGEETDSHWKFSVSDDGIGIREEFQENIFTIFQRLHTQEEYAGTGIGLAVSKKIVEKYGGEIWVDSEEGKGSTFYFTIEKK